MNAIESSLYDDAHINQALFDELLEPLQIGFAIETLDILLLNDQGYYLITSSDKHYLTKLIQQEVPKIAPIRILNQIQKVGFHFEESLQNYTNIKAQPSSHQAHNAFQYINFVGQSQHWLIYLNFHSKQHIDKNHILDNMDLFEEYAQYTEKRLKSILKNYKLLSVPYKFLSEYQLQFKTLYEQSQFHINNASHLFTLWLHKHAGQHRKSYHSYLTEREKEVLELYCKSRLTNKEIGEALNISKRTVDVHYANMHRRLQTNTKTALLKKAVSLHLIDVDLGMGS